MIESWKDIAGFDGLYQISNLGRVKSLEKTYYAGNYMSKRVQKEIILKPYSTSRYLCINLSNKGFNKNYKIHRLVALHFIPIIEGKNEVNHIDGNRLNNDVSNLEWSNRSENQLHAYKVGLQKTKKGSELVYSRPVLNTENGVFYDTISEAAISCNLSIATLSRYLNGKRNNKTNLIFC
jgi:hypothetical protein